jgi:steroid delta-isomerase-like uncharacterized protein
MAEQETVSNARDFIDAFNAHDWKRLEARMEPDCVYREFGTGRQAKGAKDIVKLLQGWAEAMPDATGAVKSAIASGGHAALELTWKGTLTGPLGRFPATGKSQLTPASISFTFKNGRIKECHQYFDSMTLYKQLGLPSEPIPA